MSDSSDLISAQEKLEWVTPKISLMEAGDTESGVYKDAVERNFGNIFYGPSGNQVTPLLTASILGCIIRKEGIVSKA